MENGGTCDRHSIGGRGGTVGPSGVCYLCRLEQAMSAYLPRDPRYRYWSHGGRRFGWTTERMGDGKFAAFEMRPVGKGSRSGRAEYLKLVREVHFAKRSTAKARARRWYEAAAARG